MLESAISSLYSILWLFSTSVFRVDIVLTQESDLSIRGLRNRSSSMGVMIDSQLPYLVGLDDDVLSTGIVIFHLKVSFSCI